MKIVTTDEMRQLERQADARGLSFATMMENAGRAVAMETMRRWPVVGKRILVLVGPGNNGGDGLVAARHLHDAGAQVTVYLSKQRDPTTDQNLRLVQDRAIPCLLADDDPGFTLLAQSLAWADLLVDALLGTGVSRPVEGVIQGILQEVAKARQGSPKRPPLVSVDLPSGLNADTGAVDPVTPYADLTVTFACPKRGLFLFPGADHVGELVVADIGIPADLASQVPINLTTAEQVRASLPPRPLRANKGTFGRVLVVAGSVNYTGAACMASVSALRVGAGLVTLACGASLHPIFATKLLEVTFLPLPEDEPGHLGPRALPLLKEALGLQEGAQRMVGTGRRQRAYTALLLGPGLGLHATTVALVRGLLSAIRAAGAMLPYVLDADGLNAVASLERWWEMLPPGGILTPHPGEMARLTGLSVAEIEANRWEIAAEKAREWGQVVILKGAYTVIASPDGQVNINPFANPGLATAGSGDVLAGAIVGLLAQGMAPFAAAVAAAYLHGLAGEQAKKEIGGVGMLAGDLVPLLPRAIAAIASPGA